MVIYRRYKPEDFERLYALEEVCFEPPSRFSRRYMQLLLQRASAATWIAKEAGQMVGFAIVDWAEEDNYVPGDRDPSPGCKNETAAYIQTVEVAPETRHQGVGRELLHCIEGSARLAGSRSIWLHVEEGNAPAIRLYETQGYRCEGREED